MKKTAKKPKQRCNYFNCTQQAKLKWPGSGAVFCEDHAALNILRFGCLIPYKKI